MSFLFEDLSTQSMLRASFRHSGQNEDEVHARALHTREMFRENAILMAGDGSISGVMARGAQAFSEHQKKLSKGARTDGKSVSDTMVWLDLLNAAMAPYESTLAEKYGENFIEKIATKYLDEETMEKLSEIEDIEKRKAAMREELFRKHAAGDIEIVEEEVRDWMDAYETKRPAYLDEINAVRARTLDEKDASLRSTFGAKAPNKTVEQVATAEVSADDNTIGEHEQITKADFAKDFLA